MSIQTLKYFRPSWSPLVWNGWCLSCTRPVLGVGIAGWGCERQFPLPDLLGSWGIREPTWKWLGRVEQGKECKRGQDPGGTHAEAHLVSLYFDVLCKCCIFYQLTRLITPFRIVVLEKTLQSPLASKEIEPVNPKGNQPWIFIGRTGAEAEATRLWSLDERSRLIGKDPNAGKDWGQEEKGMTEIEMVGWHHWLNRHVC